MTKSPQHALQDPYLNELRKTRNPVAVYLVNGIKLQGTVESFDAFVLVLRNNNIAQMVYKHAISTIVPTRPVRLHAVSEENGEEDQTDDGEASPARDPLY